MLIGISGHARVGKDTFAKMLAKELNKETYPPYVMMAFAHELKTKCQQAFDLSWEQLWGDEKEEYDMRYPKARDPLPFCAGNRNDGKGLEVLEERKHWTAREIMQEFGAFYRSIDSQFWIKNLFRVAEQKEYINIIITDVRHTNEADYILEHGGVVLRVERKSKDPVHNATHPSEIQLDGYKNFTFTIVNNWTLEVLEKTAAETVKLLKEFNK